MMLLIILILIFILVSYSVWRFGTRNFGYWKKKGVKHDEPVFFFGNMRNQFMHRMSVSEQIADWYVKFPEEKFVGVHMANDLALVLRDTELIKSVLITDFQYFHQRGFNSHKYVREPLFLNLFHIDGDAWKLLRQRLTPAFTTGKLKAMFPLIEQVTHRMFSVTEPGTHDVRELMARYTTDFIGVCGFGLDFNSLNDQFSIFRRLGKRMATVTTRDALVHMAKRLAPELFKHLNYFASEVEEQNMYLVKQALEERNYMPTGRNDFIDMLLELKQKGKITGKSFEHFNPDGSAKTAELEMDDMLIAAQVFVFFGGGFETSSSATSFLLHELAFHPEVQERCQKEVDEVLSRYDGKYCYEAIKEMKYLEMALKEAIRLHPSPAFLMRKCEKKYTFPGTNLTIDEGVLILISLTALHKDPTYFDDPETFRPERFGPENVVKIPKYAYLPFGEGPRACIGERLGIMQSLTGVAALLSRFSVKPAAITRRRPVLDPKSIFVDSVQGGLPLALVLRQSQV